jgi:GNAT superfamily N-acetyltransferase
MSTAVETPQSSTNDVLIRHATSADAQACGPIFYEAFESIANRHNLPVEPGSREFAEWKAAQLIAQEGICGLVAERDDQILGSAFVDERATIAGVGPVTVAPHAQDWGVGRALMEAVLGRELSRGAAGVRLVQTAYHYRSLSLYAKLGFVVREPLSVLQGKPPLMEVSTSVRRAEDADMTDCDALCMRIHGHSRSAELREAIGAGTARVLERSSRITGYATGFGYGWHAVAETNDDLSALLASAETFMGLGILVPSRNAELLQWCLRHGLRIVQQSHLMTTGLYNDPAGAYLPSIVY